MYTVPACQERLARHLPMGQQVMTKERLVAFGRRGLRCFLNGT